MDDILGEVRRNFLLLLLPEVVGSFIQTIVAPQNLSFTLSVLLQEQWGGCEFLMGSVVAIDANGHASLLALEH